MVFRILFNLMSSITKKETPLKTTIYSKGPPFLTINEDKTLVCTSCNRCSQVCPTQCITLDQQSIEKKNTSPSEFFINMKDCIFCGFCEDVCPDNAIYMSKETLVVDNELDYDWSWGIDRLAFRATLNRGQGIVQSNEKVPSQKKTSNNDSDPLEG